MPNYVLPKLLPPTLGSGPHDFLSQPESIAKQHLDQFSSFSLAHSCVQQTHTQTDWLTDRSRYNSINTPHLCTDYMQCLQCGPTNVMQAYNNCGLISSLMNYLNILVKTMLFYPEQLHQHTALKCAVRPPCILQQIILRTAVLQCPQQLQVVQYAGT